MSTTPVNLETPANKVQAPQSRPRVPFGLVNPKLHLQELDLREAFRKLWRHKGLILGIIAVLMTIAVIVISQLQPRYTGSAQVMINARKNQAINLEAVMSGLPLDEETIESEIQVIRSKELSERVIKKTDLYQVPEFNGSLRQPSLLSTVMNPKNWMPKSWRMALFGSAPPLSEEEKASIQRSAVIRAYQGRLSVSRLKKSRVIQISFTSHDPALAQRVANTIADLYIVDQLEAKFEATKKATNWLNDRLSSLRKQVEASERAVEEFRSSSGLTESKGTTIVSQQVSELTTQLILARSKATEAEARLDQVQNLIKSKHGISSAAEVLSSPLIQALREQEAEVLRKIGELSQEYGPKHPKMINARSELQDVRQKINAEVSRIVEGLRNNVDVSKTRVRSLETAINQLQHQVSAQNSAEVRLHALEREAKADRTLYDNFLSRFKALSGQDQIETADARVISYADLPTSPSFPKKFLLLTLAFVGSVFAGVGTAGIIERLDNAFRSMEQIENETGIPGISLIPTLPRQMKNPQDYVLENVHSAYAESLRSLFASLHLSNVDSPPKTVLMTSSIPEEGKSLTALSLARLMARTGKKIILIDCDLRRPKIHELLGIPGKPGLVEVLAGDLSLDEALVKDEPSGAYVLVAGARPPNPVDLMSSLQLKRLLATLRQAADMVIIDSAPLAAVSDARILGRLVDRTVFVVRWASTSREVVKMALKQLVDSGAEVAGVVLSRVDVRKHAKYGYGDSGYYYGRARKYYTE